MEEENSQIEITKKLNKEKVEAVFKSSPLYKEGSVISAEFIEGSDVARHFNYKITSSEGNYLVRFENKLALETRGTGLEDEYKLLKIFSKYNLSPKPLYFSNLPLNFLIEEWINGKSLESVLKFKKEHLLGLVDFIVRFNKLPVEKIKKEFRFKSDIINIAEREKQFRERLKKGISLPFLKSWREEAPIIVFEALKVLKEKIKSVPYEAISDEVISYRDITKSNIFIITPHYMAVDWESHSVGISDPSFSLTVLIRRFALNKKEQDLIINEYLKKRPTPHLRKLLKVRSLERAIGEFTWPFGWATNRVKLPTFNKKEQNNILEMIEKHYKLLKSEIKL